MIEKIDPTRLLESGLSPSRFSKKDALSDFEVLLQRRTENPAPLEAIALDFLKKAIEAALSEPDAEEREIFPPLSIPFAIRPESDGRFTSPLPSVNPDFQPVQAEPDPTVSNNSPAHRDFESIIRDAGNRYGVDPALIQAVIHAESGGDPLAESKAGARGLMQLMPRTAAELGVSNAFDPLENVMGGTRYLSRLLDRYRGDLKLALAAYNWGMGNLEKRPGSMPLETKNYIHKVESYYRSHSQA